MIMKKRIIIIFLFLAFLSLTVLSVLFYFEKNKKENQVGAKTVEINGLRIPLELADTVNKQIQGLSGREQLSGGMLFVFPDKRIRNFWMKNMHFPLDIIWIDGDRIANISQNLLPEGEHPAKTYSSISEVNYVLEVEAGFCEKNNIKIGDSVKF